MQYFNEKTKQELNRSPWTLNSKTMAKVNCEN